MAQSTQNATEPATLEVVQALNSESWQTLHELAAAAGVNPKRIESALRLLREKGAVEAKTIRIDDRKKRRTGYRLTHSGLSIQRGNQPLPVREPPEIPRELPQATPQVLLVMDATWRSFYEISMRTRLLGADIAPALNFLVLTGSAESQRVRDPDIPKRRYTEYRLTDKGLEAASEFRSTLGK